MKRVTIFHGAMAGTWGSHGGIPSSLHLGLGLLQLLLGLLLGLLGSLQVSRQRLLPLLRFLQLQHQEQHLVGARGEGEAAGARCGWWGLFRSKPICLLV